MPTIFDRINATEDRASRIESRLGHPHRHNLLLRHMSVTEANQPIIEDYLIDPQPIITNVSPRLVSLVIGNKTQAITVSALDFEAKVSRSIPYEQFVREDGKRAKAYIDPALSPAGEVLYTDALQTVSGGIECQIIYISDRDCCEWQLILRRVRDRSI